MFVFSSLASRGRGEGEGGEEGRILSVVPFLAIQESRERKRGLGEEGPFCCAIRPRVHPICLCFLDFPAGGGRAGGGVGGRLFP